MKTKILCVLDGFGIQPGSLNNAAFLANMPHFRSIISKYPWVVLDADGDSVGQEAGLVGNSEVGHMNLGGLQQVKQLSYQITQSSLNAFSLDPEIAPDQLLDPSLELKNLAQQASSTHTIHLAGLFSVGTIHSDMRHWVGAIEAAGQAGYTKIVLHIMSDGRDSDRQSLVTTWETFSDLYEDRLVKYKECIYLGSLGGRFYGMDRDNNITRTEKGLYAIVQGSLKPQEISYEHIGRTLRGYVETQYPQNTFDETLTPISFARRVQKHDVIWLINFRTDRFKQITRALCEYNDDNGLDLVILSTNSYDIGLESYGTLTSNGYHPIFKPQQVENTLAQYLSDNGHTQLHIAETEKYAHVTYFFNGGDTKEHAGETWKVIESNKVKSHAEKPEMKAMEITQHIITKGVGVYDYIIVNYANPDMVAHTGDMSASIKAMEVVDKQIGKLLEEVESGRASVIITADHGNIEEVGMKVNHNKSLVDTEHNPNPVPCIIVDNDIKTELLIDNIINLAQKIGQEVDSSKIKHSLSIDSCSQYISNDWFDERVGTAQMLPLWYASLFLIAL